MQTKELTIVGRNAKVDFIGHIKGVPAKIDTGADSSSVWASHIVIDERGVLRFTLFDKESPYYSGELIEREHYKVAMVRSTTGHEQIRYQVQFSLKVGRKRIRATLNLSDRSRSKFPVLIGRRTLKGRFMVNVLEYRYRGTERVFETETTSLNLELKKNPQAFYNKYHGKDI